jgi:histone acetyltransferase (RNA polymerase elongator complex component)
MDNSLKNFIIPVFIPHAGCPHRCIFCNQNTVTGNQNRIPSNDELNEIISTFLNYKGKKRGRVQISFYGGNFLGLDADKIDQLLNIASKYVENGVAESIRFSTRPDTVDTEKLDLIRKFPVSTIELGVQSMNDDVLELAGRGHSSSDTKNSVALLKKRNYEIGLQMMIGLPGDDEKGSVSTARLISGLSPDFVRIYPAVVLSGSRLAVMYKNGEYAPLSLDEAVAIAKKCFLIFRENNIKVIRMGLQATEELKEGVSVIAGPYHPAFGHLVYSEIFLDKALDILEKESLPPEEINIRVHPKSVSKLRGLKNSNINKIKKLFNINSVQIVPDASLESDEIKLTPEGIL